MKIAYSPFDDQDHVDAIYQNICRFHRGVFSSLLEQFDLTIRVHGRGGGQPLRTVRYDQQLYVFGHGGEASDEIECMDGSTLSLDDLAARLFLDGLSISQKVVKLFACEGGKGGDTSMAAKLKRAMVDIGFTNVTVYGYTESLAIGTRGAAQQKYSTDTGARAKSVRVKF
jgi:hypothetical protein